MKVMKITTVGYDVPMQGPCPWAEEWLSASNRDRVIWEDGEWKEHYLSWSPPEELVWETNPTRGFDGGVGYLRVTEEDGTVHEYIIEDMEVWGPQEWTGHALKVKDLTVGRDHFVEAVIEGYCF